jgi:hypothetical protein
MKVKIRLALFVALILTLLLWATPVLAVPPLPQAFYGTVLINNANAPGGTVVSAKINGVNAGSYTTTVAGQYGNVTTRDYLAVSCDGANDGDTITFYVTYGVMATADTTTFEVGGGPTEWNLSVTISGGGGGGGGGTTTVSTSFFGAQSSFKVDSSGIVQSAFTATSADGKMTITIPQGTKALDKNGNPLTSMTAEVFANPPAPPANANIIGLAYNFLPAGATFVPPITFTWSYDPAALPAGIAEEDLVIAYYDATAGTWVELQCVVDTANNKITASVPHYTTFTIIGTFKPAAFAISSLVVSPVQVAPGEKVDINLSVANTGGTEGSYTVVLNINGVKEAEKSVTVAAGSIQTVTFSVTKAEAGSYSVTVDGLSGSFIVVAPAPTTPAPTTPAPTTPAPTTPAPTTPAPTTPAPTVTPEGKGFNWPLVGGIIGGVVIIALVIFIFIRRRD